MAKKTTEEPTQEAINATSTVVPVTEIPASELNTSEPTIQAKPVTTTTNINAANQPYQANRPTNFKVTGEGSKYGIIDMNGTVGHIQPNAGQKFRDAATNQRIAKLYQEELAPNSTVDMNDPAAVQNFVTKTYNENRDKIPSVYQKRGLIESNQDQQPETKPVTPEAKKDALSVLEEANRKGVSFLDLYKQAIQKPVYDKKRANSLKENANLSVLADILKLVGEGVTTHNGGTPIARNSDTATLNASLQKLNDNYKQNVQSYNAGKFQYMMADERDNRNRVAQQIANAEKKAEKQQAQDNWKATYDRSIENDNYNHTRNTTVDQNKSITDQARLKLEKERNDIARIAANKKGSSDEPKDERPHTVIINGQPVKVPMYLINDVSGRAKQDNLEGAAERFPIDNFIANYNKYYQYNNGQFMPVNKGTAGQKKVNVPVNQRVAVQQTKPITKPVVKNTVNADFQPNGKNSLLQTRKPKSIYD